MKRHKSSKFKIGVIILGVIIFFGFIGIKFLLNRDENIKGNDLKIGVINDNAMELVSVSQDRKMINVLKIGDTLSVWLPNGMGWLKLNQAIKTIKEDKTNKIGKEMFWYNFGFTADEIVFNKGNDIWKDDWYLINKMGIATWLKYKAERGQMLIKEETISKDLAGSNLVLDEMMSRDFAENQVLNEDLKLSVFNATLESGLADFIGERLQWAGFSVLNTDNTSEKIDQCLLVYGPGLDKSFGIKILKQNFSCQTKYDENLNDNEAELYFGEKFVSMLKYSSYKR
jgi:hypothetical protein